MEPLFTAPGPPPEARLKDEPTVASRAQLEQAIAELRWLDATDGHILAALKAKKQELEEAAAAARSIDGLSTAARREQLLKAAEAYVAAHRAELFASGAKSAEIAEAVVGFRKATDRIDWLDGLDEAQVLTRLYDAPTGLIGHLQAFLRKLDLLGRLAPVEVSKATRRKFVVSMSEATAQHCEALEIADGPNAGMYRIAEYELVDDARVCLELADGHQLPRPSEPPSWATPIIRVRASQILELTPKISKTKAKTGLSAGTLAKPQLAAVGLVPVAGEDAFFLKL